MQPFPMKGAVAVVTGAASGIGAALSPALAAKGCDLAICDLNDVGLQRTAEACRAAGVKVSTHILDVANAQACADLPAEVIAEHGKVSILVNNAGVALFGRFDEMTLDDFEWVMSINFFGVVRLTKAFLPHLNEQAAAHIANISSIFGVIAPPGQTAYCASKFGVRGFSESLRHELAGSNVTLTVIHPGGVATNIANSARVAQNAVMTEDPETRRERLARFLSKPPAEAAADIVRAIETRAPKLLIGQDARRMELLQRLFPVTYWPKMARSMR
ncbi:MAG TPA: SDR family NAD(P)-dependent oxidoreductase [Caulobacteraceae bacterium]|nr:SDR family NAD(P)-dependent oxidoreductase [Caulobacteraceae bacterium]